MFALAGNVAGDAAEVTYADCEGGIPSLPFKVLVSMSMLGDEMSRRTFDVLQQIGDRQHCGQPNEQMHMILSATDGQHFRAEFTALRLDGSMRVTFHRSRQQW